jgi:hypothetical protein
MGGVRRGQGEIRIEGVRAIDNPEHVREIERLKEELHAEREKKAEEKVVHVDRIVDRIVEKVVPDPVIVEKLNQAHLTIAELNGRLRQFGRTVEPRVIEKVVEVEKVVEKEVVKFVDRIVHRDLNHKLAAAIAAASLIIGSGVTATFKKKDAEKCQTSSISQTSSAQVPSAPLRPARK